MMKIPLSRGLFAQVDDEDFDRANAFKWHTSFTRRKDGSVGIVYAVSHVCVDGKKTKISLHRFIMGVTNPKIDVDHENHDGLDNQRNNLRTCTRSQNQWNSRLRSTTISGIKGVSFDKRSNKWRAQIRGNGKMRSLGYFLDKSAAGEAYKVAAIKAFGEFACLTS